MLGSLHGPGVSTFVENVFPESGRSLRVFSPLGTERCGGTKPRTLGLRRAAVGDAGSGPDGPIASVVPNVEELLPLLRSKTDECGGSGPGCVFLVGTGPGDPGLLTLRAAQVMASADVVLYDRLVSNDILRMVNPAARMVYVGKQTGFHTRTQDQIHELLIQFATTGATVLRLKGGDPYVFGRGGEEMEFLQSHGIPVHCIPGITAASGISAELGIPLTHRGLATTVRFLTGHSRAGGEEELDKTMREAVDPKATLVVYMGLQTLPRLTEKLVGAGQDPRTPSVAVERGTTPDQRIVFAHLDELPSATQDAGLTSPTLIIIGEVVGMAPGWKAWTKTGVALQTGRYRNGDPMLPEVNFADRGRNARASVEQDVQ